MSCEKDGRSLIAENLAEEVKEREKICESLIETLEGFPKSVQYYILTSRYSLEHLRQWAEVQKFMVENNRVENE